MSGRTLQGRVGLGEPLPRGSQFSRSRSACRHQIPTGLHANLSEGRPVGPARQGASSLLSPEGFFLGKMGFREAVAAGTVSLPQVRMCGGVSAGRCSRGSPRLPSEGTVKPLVAGAGDGCFPSSNVQSHGGTWRESF